MKGGIKMPNMITEKDVVNYLKNLEPGFLPLEIFLEMARLNVLTSVEVIPLKFSKWYNKTQVLLTKRPEGDTWEGQWHAPGSMMRASDSVSYGHDVSAPLGRILGDNGELKGTKVIGDPVFVGHERRKTKRGDELSLVYYVEVIGEPNDGEFFSTDSLLLSTEDRGGVIDHHVVMILEAARRFESDRSL